MQIPPEGVYEPRKPRALVLRRQLWTDSRSRWPAGILGSASEVSVQDTVPFCLSCAAHRLDNFEEALRWTVRGLGDRDTTCAIVGSIVALSAPVIPALWLERREALPRI